MEHTDIIEETQELLRTAQALCHELALIQAESLETIVTSQELRHRSAQLRRASQNTRGAAITTRPTPRDPDRPEE